MKRSINALLIVVLVLILFLPTMADYLTVANGDFESWTGGTGGPPDNWTNDNTSFTSSQEATTVHGGSYSVNLTWTSQSNQDFVSDMIGVTGDELYTITAWMYDNDIAGRLRLCFEWYDAGQAYLSASYSGSYSADAPAWSEYSYAVNANSSAAYCKILIRQYDVSADWDGDATVYVDDVTLFEGTGTNLPPEIGSVYIYPYPLPFGNVAIRATVTDLDGTIDDDSLYYQTSTLPVYTPVYHDSIVGDYYWYTIPSQTPGTFVEFYLQVEDDQAERIESSIYDYTAVDLPATSLQNGDFETWTNPAGLPDYWFQTSSSYTASMENTEVHGGSNSVNLTFTSTSTQSFSSHPFEVVGGQTYTCSLYVFDNDMAGYVRIYFQSDDGPTYIATNSGDTSGVWQKMEVEYVAPANATWSVLQIRMYDQSGEWDGDATIFVDDIYLEEEIPQDDLSTITLKANSDDSLVIVDQGPGDANPAVGTIAFGPVVVGGILTASGTLIEVVAGPTRSLTLTDAIFRNTDPALNPHIFTISFWSSVFPAFGPPSVWAMNYDGWADDPTPADVWIPTNAATGWVNRQAILLANIPGPVIGPVATPPAVRIGPLMRAGALGVGVTSIEGELMFDPRPGDQIRLPRSIKISIIGPDTVSINDIQYTTDIGDICYDSPLEDSLVVVAGKVTGVYQGTYQNSFLQDCSGNEWDGLFVYEDINELAVGDYVVIEGYVEEAYGNTRISNVQAYDIVTVGNDLCTLSVTSDDLATQCDIDGEPYEGMLVMLENATCVVGPDFYGVAYIKTPCTTDSCAVDDDMYRYGADQPEPLVKGQTYDSIIGCVRYYYDEYKLNPRFESDVVFAVDNCSDSLITECPDWPDTAGIDILTSTIFEIEFYDTSMQYVGPIYASGSATIWRDAYDDSLGYMLTELTDLSGSGNSPLLGGNFQISLDPCYRSFGRVWPCVESCPTANSCFRVSYIITPETFPIDTLISTALMELEVGCGPGAWNPMGAGYFYAPHGYRYIDPRLTPIINRNGYLIGYATHSHFIEEEGPDDKEYLPGDANMFNGLWPPSVIGADVTYLVNYFRGQPSSQPCNLCDLDFWGSADANGDCLVIGSDVTKLVNYFRGFGNPSYCPDLPPAWPTPDDLPLDAPSGWPNCNPLPPTNVDPPSDLQR
ncbi:MAG: hypothetical protein GY839_10435 [candidate division Zixibacteria bacterium]|nr:hypothetical protein [candidate division Zixibacteria bacterium]